MPSRGGNTPAGGFMWYVYMRHIDSGREEFVGVYDTAKEAVKKIALCYRVDDRNSAMTNEYYYFMKRH